MVSPLCEVKNGGAAYVTSVGGVDVTPAATIIIRLADANVDSWSIQCVTTDETNVAATIQAALTIDSLNKTATFTAPVAGAALRFRSVVNSGIGPDGVVRSAYSTTFCIYTLVGGNRVVAADETTEGGDFGWLTAVNSLVRTSVYTSPTGTGIPHIVAGSQNAAASLIVNADVDAAAAIAGSKLVAASGAVAGSMSAADKTKLDGIQKQGTTTAIAAMAIDWALGMVYTKTLAAGANVFTFSNAASGMSIIVRVTGAASTLTWPTVLWAGGVAPTQTASGKDVYTFIHDGTDIYGSVVQDFS